MSLSHDQMLDLMAYADGELAGDERARVEGLLKDSEEARRVVDAMGALGEVVREGVDARAEAASAADGIADHVMAAIEHEPAVARGAEVVPLAAARHRRGGGVMAAGVAVLALAAGAVLMLKKEAPAPALAEAPVEMSAEHAAAPTPAPAPEPLVPAAAVAQNEEAPGVDLEEAHSTKNKLDVIFVSPAAAGAAASVVVWIDDKHGGH